MNDLEKLELINTMEFVDNDADGENCSSVTVEDNKTNRNILYQIGLSNNDIGELIDEEGYINIAHVAFKYSNWWNGDYFENKVENQLKEFYGAVSLSGRVSFFIKSEDIESAEDAVFEDIEGIELILKDGSKLEISEINWELINEASRGNVRQSNIDDFEIYEEK
ncbi:hypothetical protein KQI86_19190 [Clostridium sp. MSJ-11]|uniref:Uncharacterized protein n=1 Tax=Clostridium mobile TaxID=2841512 RepID=A0ABS6EPX4_9CLOT|nr:hypothetical protein [Clostridium mobile]MBU5486429.1 hypothetical protein [Clostridium mobile]